MSGERSENESVIIFYVNASDALSVAVKRNYEVVLIFCVIYINM